MSTICKCDSGISSLFVGGCKGISDITSRLIPFERFDGQGIRNFLDVSTAPIPSSVFAAAFKNSDPKKRFHITPIGMNPTWVENEANDQTFDGGEIKKLSDGTTVLTLMVIEVTAQEAAKYKQLECGINDIMIVTQSGQLVGYASPQNIADGQLFGLPVQNISVLYQGKTNASVSAVTITITFSKSMNLGNIVVVDAENIEVDLLQYREPKGAIIKADQSTVTTSSVVVTVMSEYYGISGQYPIVGLTPSDFKVYNVSDLADVTVLFAQEGTPGVYTLQYGTQVSGDDLYVELDTATSNVNVISDRSTYSIP